MVLLPFPAVNSAKDKSKEEAIQLNKKIVGTNMKHPMEDDDDKAVGNDGNAQQLSANKKF